MRYEFKLEDALRFAHGKEYQFNGDEMVFKFCPYCHGGKNRDQGSFAINKRTGAFNCKRNGCMISGNMITLAKDFDDFSLGNEIDEYIAPKKTFTEYPVPKDFVARISDPILNFLHKRHISKATAERYHLQWKKDAENILAFPFMSPDGKTIQCTKYRKIDFDRSKGDRCKEWFQKGMRPVLFGMDQCNTEGTSPLIVTEGQLDSLAVSEAGVPNAVSVPNGCSGFSWIPYCYDFIEKFDTIIIFGDNEHGEITLVDEFVKRWRNKVKIVRSEDYCGYKDANDILINCGAEQIMKCIANAAAPPVKKVIRMCDVQKVNVDELEKLPTGIRKLDGMLHGGLPFGGVTVLTGKAGEGKSTFASQVMVSAINEGYGCLVYSGEMTNGMIRETIDRQIAGPEEIEMRENQWGDSYAYLSQDKREKIAQWYQSDLYLYDSDDVSEEDEKDELISTIKDTVFRYGVRVVLLDNLMTAIDMDSSRNQNEYAVQTDFMKKLVRTAKSMNILILMVAHKRKSGMSDNGNDEVSGSSNITNLAMVTLSYEREANADQFTRKLKVFKNRLFGTIDREGIRMTYDTKSKRVFNAEAELNTKYEWDFIPVQEDLEIPF